MGSVSLTGADTIQIDGRILNDLADGDCVMVSFPNELATMKTSKNGNTIYGFNNSGKMVDCKLRVLLGSADDKYLNSRMAQMDQDFAMFGLLTGSFAKRVGDGAGNTSTVVYQMAGGIFKKHVEAKTSSEGETEQSVAEYTMAFLNDPRSIQ